MSKVKDLWIGTLPFMQTNSVTARPILSSYSSSFASTKPASSPSAGDAFPITGRYINKWGQSTTSRSSPKSRWNTWRRNRHFGTGGNPSIRIVSIRLLRGWWKVISNEKTANSMGKFRTKYQRWKVSSTWWWRRGGSKFPATSRGSCSNSWEATW